MNTVGQILKKTRELKNITITQVASDLKISSEILIKFESDETNNHMDIVFILGHLKSYSKYLSLDHDLIIKQFKEQESLNIEVISNVIPRPSFENKYSSFYKIIPFSLVIIIFTSFYFLFINEDRNSSEYALVPDLPEIYEPIIEKENLETANINNLEKEKINYKNNENITVSSVLASNKILNEKNETITLKFLNPTWFQVRDEADSIVLSKLMEKNEEYSYNIKNYYTITAGNAGNILVLIDNNVRGKIGKQGEVVDSLYIDNKFNN
ncbi:DUF4115 domain-containing protein [Pelagibacteraceae bacterium]|nr:DUF4115 domain-containing protein [Pelagibacteraceae bacterium]